MGVLGLDLAAASSMRIQCVINVWSSSPFKMTMLNRCEIDVKSMLKRYQIDTETMFFDLEIVFTSILH